MTDDVPDMVDIAGGVVRSALGGTGRITVAGFRLARVPTTNRQFAGFCADTGAGMALHTPSWGLSDDDPVVNVGWYDAVEFANWSSARVGLRPVYRIDKDRPDPHNVNRYDQVKWTVVADWSADGFRLPTEAEWEYAAGGGQEGPTFRFAGSDDLDEVGWYADNSDGRAHPVAAKRPNALDVHDLSGNVWEWCWDWYAEALAGADQDDPVGPDGGTFRVVRGGSWYVEDDLCLVENRNYANPPIQHHAYGVRLAQRG